MLKDRLAELFREQSKDVQEIIGKVLAFEQENIDKKTPPYKDEIKKYVDEVVRRNET